MEAESEPALAALAERVRIDRAEAEVDLPDLHAGKAGKSSEKGSIQRLRVSNSTRLPEVELRVRVLRQPWQGCETGPRCENGRWFDLTAAVAAKARAMVRARARARVVSLVPVALMQRQGQG